MTCRNNHVDVQNGDFSNSKEGMEKDIQVMAEMSTTIAEHTEQ